MHQQSLSDALAVPHELAREFGTLVVFGLDTDRACAARCGSGDGLMGGEVYPKILIDGFFGLLLVGFAHCLRTVFATEVSNLVVC